MICGIVTMNTTDTKVKNLVVDFPHPSVVEAEVIAATATTFDLIIHPSNNYTITKEKTLMYDKGHIQNSRTLLNVSSEGPKKTQTIFFKKQNILAC